MDPFFIQRQMFEKLSQIDCYLQKIRVQLAKKTLQRAQQLDLLLNKDLADRCMQYLQKTGKQNYHTCKFCSKVFDDGRKLGGHVSRAHKTQIGNFQTENNNTIQQQSNDIIQYSGAKIERPINEKNKIDMKNQKRVRKNKENDSPVSIAEPDQPSPSIRFRTSLSKYNEQKSTIRRGFCYSAAKTLTKLKEDEQSQQQQSIPSQNFLQQKFID